MATITGYQEMCECEHCGRSLKIGICVSGLGIIGADCFNKMIVSDRKRFSGNGKPGAPYLRELAIRSMKSPEYLSRRGYSSAIFDFEIAA
jgi:hypothetical protein